MTASFSNDYCSSSQDITLSIQEPAVSIEKSLDPNTHDRYIVYDITVTNTGVIPASNLVITDTLPGTIPDVFSVGFSTPEQIEGSVPYTIASSSDTGFEIDIASLGVGESTTFQVTATLSPTFDSGTPVVNTVDLTYYSIPVPPITSDVRVYNGSSSVSYNIQPTLCVTVANITQDHTGEFIQSGSNPTVGAAIGDVLEYTVIIKTIPSGATNFENIVFTYATSGLDISLNQNIYVTATSNLPPLLPLPPTNALLPYTVTTNTITFNINNMIDYEATHDVNAYYSFNFYVRVSNSLPNQAGVIYDPSPVLNILNESMQVVTVPNDSNCQSSFLILEPNITLTKTLTSSPIYPSGTVTYSVVLTSNLTTTSCSSYDNIIDDLGFTNPNIFISATTTIPTNWNQILTDIQPRELRLVNQGEFIPGTMTSFTMSGVLREDFYEVSAIGSENSLLFTNNVTMTYSSMNLNATQSGVYARNGTDGPGGLNDYLVQANTTTMFQKPLIQKIVISTTHNPAQVGDIITYGIIVTLPIGTSTNISVTDTLASNVTYNTSSSTIQTTVAGSGGILENDFAGTVNTSTQPVVSPTSLTWIFSNPDIVVNNVTDPTMTSFLIKFIVTVNSIDSSVLTNTAQLYNETTLLSTSTAEVPLAQPLLYIQKVVDSRQQNWSAGDTIPYKITVGHAALSTANAYNLVITDTALVGNVISGVTWYILPTAVSMPIRLPRGSNMLEINVPELDLGNTLTILYYVTIAETAFGNQTEHSGAHVAKCEWSELWTHNINAKCIHWKSQH